MKELMEFDYVEADGLLYPRIEVDGKDLIDDLGKYGRMRLDYLREHRPGMYRELLVSGRLAGHCKCVDELGFEMAEQIRGVYLSVNRVSDEDCMERMKIYTMAQYIADEVVLHRMVYY